MTESDRAYDSPDFERIDVPRLLSLLGIQAKKKGRAWQAICPSGAHADRHPSWSIREEPGTKRNGKHHCFSCKFSGTAVELTEHVLGLSFCGASQFIFDRALKEVHPALSVRLIISSPVRSANCSIPGGVYFDPLDKWIPSARRYAEKRRITADQVTRWGLGYAIDGRIRGRIVIPTHDRYGRLVGWTARTFVDNEKRYLAASSEDNPDVDGVFGEQFWPGKIEADDVLFVLEGALNALAVERALPDDRCFIGALSGSHLEPGHALKLSRFQRVCILTDPDPAGDKAADGLLAMLGRHVHVYRERLQEGTDCDSTDPATLKDILCTAVTNLRSL